MTGAAASARGQGCSAALHDVHKLSIHKLSIHNGTIHNGTIHNGTIHNGTRVIRFADVALPPW